jgi:transposase InsO family protein
MTDNAPAYYSRAFTQACLDLGIKQLYTKPYTPRTNSKAERFIQSALREWAYARAYTHSRQRAAALAPWLHSYNWHRPHASLAGQPPITRLGLDRNNLLRLHT